MIDPFDMNDSDNQQRTVEARYHVSAITLTGGTLFTNRARATWPIEMRLPGLQSSDFIRVQASVHRFDSSIFIDHQIALHFTWVESPEWTVEEFIFNGALHRFEYRTRWPEFPGGED